MLEIWNVCIYNFFRLEWEDFFFLSEMKISLSLLRWKQKKKTLLDHRSNLTDLKRGENVYFFGGGLMLSKYGGTQICCSQFWYENIEKSDNFF